MLKPPHPHEDFQALRRWAHMLGHARFITADALITYVGQLEAEAAQAA